MEDLDNISKLDKLFDEGVLTQEEYNAKKAQILRQANVDSMRESEEKIKEINISKDATDDDLRSKRISLIGKNAEHYIPIFEALDKKGGSSWNWCGFFISFVWFAYRKLYGWAAIAFLAPLVGGFVCGLILYSTTLDETIIYSILRVLGFAFNIVFGIVANSAYKKKIDKYAREMPQEDAAKAKFIQSKGGVSVIAAIIMIALYIGEIVLNNI